MTSQQQRAATLRKVAGAIYDDPALSITACWALITTFEDAYDKAIGGDNAIYHQESNEISRQAQNGDHRTRRSGQDLHITAHRL